MRNSTARERIPTTCRHVRYEGGHAKSCTKPFRHTDPKHSFDEDEEGDMRPRDARQEAAGLACDESVTCPADFHNFTCQTYWREQTQQAPYHSHLAADGTLTTTNADGSITVTTANGKTVTYPAPSDEFLDRLREQRGAEPSQRSIAEAVILHTSEEKTGGRAEVSHHTAGGMETIDFIYAKLGIDGGHDYVLGNILKYAARAKYKGQFESDVEKIRNYAVIMQEQEAKREGKTNG